MMKVAEKSRNSGATLLIIISISILLHQKAAQKHKYYTGTK